jgi:hypothetical protein
VVWEDIVSVCIRLAAVCCVCVRVWLMSDVEDKEKKGLEWKEEII